jgi:AbrB family looped-hinge helix DNA binding protein
MEPQPRQNEFAHINVDKAGRVVIPASMRQRYGIHEGDKIVINADEEGIHITTIDQAVKRAQAICARYIKPGVSLVDELMRERREEAAREERE